jgi:hypothetical protein
LCKFLVEESPAVFMEKEKLVTPYITMWFHDGILYGRYAEGLDVSLDIAKELVESRILYSEGKSCPMLIDMKGVKSATPQAREYLATIGATHLKAGALIVGSQMNMAIGNVFLMIDKPLVPTKLFTNEDRAVEWLRQYAG